ncbi:MAG: TlpA family protein disulfide reductase [Planctomycetaceae bacterium]|nr:TlpA family protein disulfide reductase [Planctomycetaceae bacterium]
MLSFVHRCSLMTLLTLTFAVTANHGTCRAADGMVVTEFSGSLIQPGNGDGEILRRFEAQIFTTDAGAFFHVTDDVRQGCPWPDSYGPIGPGTGAERVQPHLVYPYDGNTYFLPLPPLVVKVPDDAAEETTWEQSGWQMKIIEKTNMNGTPAWAIEARERRGRQQQLTVDASTGVLLRAEADVFMGMGDQFLMSVARSGATTLSAEQSESMVKLQQELINVQTSLRRRPDAVLAELSPRQVTDVMASLDKLSELAKSSPLEALTRQIRTDVEQQQKRIASATSRAGELMNADAPVFSLNLVSGGKLESSSLKGKTVILHFWDYRDAPLSEPYGQTGYLEFLFNRRKAQEVVVVGVSTNQDLQTAENQNRGRRAARKLSEFMNLTYPIGHDDGSLLKAFGDPRDNRGQLPLWVVLSPEGKVMHYHAGFYEIDQAQGLRDLEAVLAKGAKR